MVGGGEEERRREGERRGCFFFGVRRGREKGFKGFGGRTEVFFFFLFFFFFWRLRLLCISGLRRSFSKDKNK